MSNEYKDWCADLSAEQKQNYELCVKYPFLVPRDIFTGEEDKNYFYEYTYMDDIPDGWRIAFGEQWAQDIQDVINKMPDDERNRTRVWQLKEKYGMFTQYFSHYNDELSAVIQKYSLLSAKTCVHCGKPATKISQEWISPWCDECAEKVRDTFVSIDEWFNGGDE